MIPKLSLRNRAGAKPSRAERSSIKSRLREGIHTFPLRTTKVAAPLQFTSDGIFAWYILGTLNWEFMTLSERIQAWDLQRSRFGQVAEAMDVPQRPIQIRRTTRPYGAFQWAARLDAESEPLPDVDGAENWATYLAHAQNRLGSDALDQRLTAVGVWIGPVPSDQVVAELVDGSDTPSEKTSDIVAELAELDQLFQEESVTGGFNATRATSTDMAFLFHRSLSMGLPAPKQAGAGVRAWGEFGEFVDRCSWITAPFSETVKIVGRVDGQIVERHVTVLTMGEMPDQTWPERGNDAWLMASDWLGIPVEWSVNGALVRGSQVEKAAVLEAALAKDMAKHYREHDQDPPPATERAIHGAIQTYDEVTAGDSRVAPRFIGTIRAAVYGDTAPESLANARKLATFYADTLRMPLHITLDQVRALREFVPGEPRVKTGWTRRMGVSYLAAAMPHIDAEVGTKAGPYLGYSALSRQAVLFDPHWAMANNRPGLITIAGEPGSGKSYSTGIMAYSMVMTGKRVVIEDPSGPLAALTRFPELAPFSSELNLTRADEGTLSPPQMIPTPLRENYTNREGVLDEFEYQTAVRRARAERTQLSFDVLRMQLTPSLVKQGGVDQRLSDALDEIGNHPYARGVDQTMWNLRWVLEELKRGDELCHQIWRELEAAARFPGGSLVVPEHSNPVEFSGLDDKRLVVVTMPGITAPPVGESRDFWGASERYAVPLIHLAAFFASRSVYSRSRHEPKGVILDEGDTLVQHPSGRILVNRLGSDSRKWNTAVLFASQDPGDSVAVGERLESLIGARMVFRLRSDRAARRACETLNINPEYASAIQTLQTGEAVFSDPQGRVAKIVIDGDWHPSFPLLDTTPRPARQSYSLDLPPSPLLDPRLFEGLAS